MYITRSAILAFVIIITTCVLCTTEPTLAGDELDSPRRVRFQLADGARVQGEITAWDQIGVTGTFGRRAWSEIHHDDVWRIYRALMDTHDPSQWANLGKILLTLEGGEKNAERAFLAALNLDSDAQELVEQARAEAADILQQRRAQQAKADQQKLDTGNPEAREYTTELWPSISAVEQAGYVEQLKERAASAFQRAAIDPTVIETDRFLLYSQMTREEALKWARLLDRTYEQLAAALLPDPDDPAANNIFHGNAVVLCFDEYDRFQIVEAEMFHHLSARAVHGLMHPAGGEAGAGAGAEVYINIWRDPDAVAFGENLCRLATHGFLHRYRAPRRLPMWANEGLALWATERALTTSTVQPIHRARALQYIRSGGDVRAALSLTYEAPTDETSRDREGAVTPSDIASDVGYLLTEMLLRENPAAFRKWVAAVKTGKDWPEALSDAYNVPINSIIDRFAQWYRVNN